MEYHLEKSIMYFCGRGIFILLCTHFALAQEFSGMTQELGGMAQEFSGMAQEFSGKIILRSAVIFKTFKLLISKEH